MIRLEAVVDGIGKLNGMLDPATDAYKLRNPLLVESHARLGKHETDEQGRRIFKSLLNGYKAAHFDIELKCLGKSRSRVNPESSFSELLVCYKVSNKQSVDYVVNFVRRALQDDTISANTPLKYFLENENGRTE
jgi:hypothetical protein